MKKTHFFNLLLLHIVFLESSIVKSATFSENGTGVTSPAPIVRNPIWRLTINIKSVLF